MLSNEVKLVLEAYKKCATTNCGACASAIEKAIDARLENPHVHVYAALGLFMSGMIPNAKVGDMIEKARAILSAGPHPILQRIKVLEGSLKAQKNTDVIKAVLDAMPNYGAKGICKHCGAKEMDFRKHGEHCKWAKALRALAETVKGMEESKEEKPVPHEEPRKEVLISSEDLVKASPWATNIPGTFKIKITPPAPLEAMAPEALAIPEPVAGPNVINLDLYETEDDDPPDDPPEEDNNA